MLNRRKLFQNVILILLVLMSCTVLGTEYYVSPGPEDKGDGSLKSPWQSLSTAVENLRPGDTLFLRDGVYYESDVFIELRGQPNAKIVIRSYPGERATIVSSDKASSTRFLKPWRLVDADKQIYQLDSVIENSCMAWLTNEDLLLWRYATREDFTSEWSSGRYCGPGVFQQDNKLFLRIATEEINDDQQARPKSTFPTDIDGYRKSLRFTTGETNLTLEICSHVELADIDFHGGSFACVNVSDKSRHISIKNCTFRFSVYGLIIQSECQDVSISGCMFCNGFSDTSRWGDIKNGDPPPLESFNSCAVVIEESKRINVDNNDFRRCFQAVSLDATDAKIRDNKLLRPHEAILISPRTTAEISGNVILHALEAFSLVGGTEGDKPGRVFLHHNIVDLSGLRFVERQGNFGDFQRRRTTGWDFIGSHDCDDTCEEAVFLIYNNTIIGGAKSGESGWNAAGTPLRSLYKKHVEYNNIFVSYATGLLDPSVDKSAGNVVWQTSGGVVTKEMQGLAVDPAIDVTKWLQVDVESMDIATLRQCYLPENESVLTTGYAVGVDKWPGAQRVNYRGAVPKN